MMPRLWHQHTMQDTRTTRLHTPAKLFWLTPPAVPADCPSLGRFRRRSETIDKLVSLPDEAALARELNTEIVTAQHSDSTPNYF